ncbi:MAG TPA: hypothetical protein VGA34_01020 [Alteraurantiacibacter sp.]|jgi:hypothetical protein
MSFVKNGLAAIAAFGLMVAPIAVQARSTQGALPTEQASFTRAGVATADGERLGGDGEGTLLILLLISAAIVAAIIIIGSDDEDEGPVSP